MSEPPRVPLILDYRAPEKTKRYHFVPAALLCLPGLLCWATVFSRMTLFLAEDFMVLWGLAIITALASLVLYLRPPGWSRPWYVWVCLTFNVIGLAASAWVAYALLVEGGLFF